MQTSPEVETGTHWSLNRSRFKRYLSACATLGLFLTVGLSMTVLVSNNQRSNSPKVFERQTSARNIAVMRSDDSVCNTPGCKIAADRLIRNMDKNIDPCHNFFAFACNGFESASPRIRQKRYEESYFSLNREKIKEQLLSFIEKPIQENEIKPFKLVKKFYLSCRNANRTEDHILESLREIIDRFGGWPVLMGDKWRGKFFAWDQVIYEFIKDGYPTDYFFKVSVEPNSRNRKSRVIYLQRPDPYMPSKMEKVDLEYVAMELGANIENVRKELNEAIKFQHDLDAIQPSQEQLKHTFNPMTIEELQAKVPGIPWLKYINNFLAPYHVVTENEKVIATVPDYFLKLSELLAKTPKRTLANYFIWKVIHFSQGLWGSFSWKHCIEDVSDRFPIVAGAIYVRNFFDQEVLEPVTEIVKDIRSVYVETLDEKKWLDSNTKAYAQKKLAAMMVNVGYPVELLDDKKLIDLYPNLALSPDDYHGNYLDLSIHDRKQSVQKLREPYNRTEWISYGNSYIVNAFNQRAQNIIQIAAGISQSVFFGKDRPAYLNYAGNGWTIGHEFTHGFDNKGYKYDSEGNIFDWWEPSTKDKYNEIAKCFIDQYGNYSVPEIGMHVNGLLTEAENIADNGGIKVAYRAYMKWANRHKKRSQNWDQVEQRLPGLTEYNVRQLFWIGAANCKCDKIAPSNLRNTILNNDHAPRRFRVIGTFSNNPQFASDFNCPVGSPMNPVHKCDLW